MIPLLFVGKLERLRWTRMAVNLEVRGMATLNV